MRLLLFSDIHCDHIAAQRLVDRSADADAMVCAGDLAVMRTGLQETVDILARARCPAVLVAGNGESVEELVAACSGWEGGHVLHGSGQEIDGIPFWGLGGAVPVTPFGAWSFDMTEDQASELLADCPLRAVLVTHSPPFGHVDMTNGAHLGSRAVLETVAVTAPRLAVCGHIHACWEQEARVGRTRVINAGPAGVWVDI
jgi:Icc-related predicted phosphoesterase